MKKEEIKEMTTADLRERLAEMQKAYRQLAVSVVFFGFIHELAINGVFFFPFDGHGDGFVAFVPTNDTD